MRLDSIIFSTSHKIYSDDRLPQHVSGVSGLMSPLVLVYPGSPGQRAVKWQCVCIYIKVHKISNIETAVSAHIPL